MKKETKKQGAKLSKKEIETLNKVYTIEDLKKDFLEANSDLLQLSKNIGCKYAPAHKNFDMSPAPGKRTRIQLIVDGVTKQFDKVELQKLTDTYNPKTTPKTGKNNGLSLVEKLEKELEEKEARVKEIKENLLPAAREEAAKKKEEAQNKASEKATLSISKMIGNYIAAGMTAAEATEKVLKQVEEEAKKAAANA